MKNTVLAILSLALAASALAQASKATSTDPAPTTIVQAHEPLVSVTAKGTDVREVLSQICAQAHAQYVLDSDTHYALFLSLEDSPFSKTVDIVCKQASLRVEKIDGVYFFHRGKAKPILVPKVETPITLVKKPIPTPKTVTPTGTLSTKVLGHRVTTRMKKADFKSVMDEFGRQAGIKIEVAPNVPSLKLDAYMIGTSLKYALDRVTEATETQYTFTNRQTILVHKAGN